MAPTFMPARPLVLWNRRDSWRGSFTNCSGPKAWSMLVADWEAGSELSLNSACVGFAELMRTTLIDPKLYIDPSCFTPVNLREPFEIGEKYDLAISVEVAEHLPEAAGQMLVKACTSAAGVVMFSAAVPGQGAPAI